MQEHDIAEAVCLVLIYENEIHKDATDSQRKQWKDAAIVIDGHTVGSPFVDGVDISIFNDKDKFFVASFHNCERNASESNIQDQ